MIENRGVEIELDKPRKFRYDFNAIADLEDKAGCGIAKFLSEEKAGISTIRLLTWAGLKWQDKGMTIERAGSIVQRYIEDGGILETLSSFIGVALKMSGVLGDGKEEDTEGNQTAEAVN